MHKGIWVSTNIYLIKICVYCHFFYTYMCKCKKQTTNKEFNFCWYMTIK